MSSAAVDEFVKTRVLPQHRDIVRALRTLIAECAPRAEEVILYGSPAWRGNRSMAIISPSKTHITLAFDRGAEFEDPYGLLAGSGKRTRHVKIKSLDAMDERALRDYLRQAVHLDSE